MERARIFFAEAIIPIEKTHPAALKAGIRLRQLSQRLGRRTVDLAASHQCLKQGIARRKTVEEALRQSGVHSEILLMESRRQQKQLQLLTHQMLAAQEEKRKRISHDLQDELSQILGINVQLLALKQDSAVTAARVQKEIAITRRLVDQSVKSLGRFALEFGAS